MCAYQTGMDRLINERFDLIQDGRVGLVCNPASTNRLHPHSAVLLRERLGNRLACLIGPEHGCNGHGAAGEKIANEVHSEWGIPILSLFGDETRALQEMVERVDAIIFDLQDLGVRCYTYVHTLRRIMETADRHNLHLIVADRPAPFAGCLDGPMLNPRFESIIAPISAPLVYGMTPGETAQWLKTKLGLKLTLDTVAAGGYRRNDPHGQIWPSWEAPSPAIRSWNCAMSYPATVFTEALPHLDCARATLMAFRVLRAKWLNPAALIDLLQTRNLPGVSFAPYYDLKDASLPGMEIRINDSRIYRPVLTGVSILWAIQQAHGPDRLWKEKKTNTNWFDRLMGTDRVRLMLEDGESPDIIAAGWEQERASFMKERNAAALDY